jgi:hypothetical protein
VVQGMVAHFGKYSVNEADLTLAFHVEKVLFPKWDGTDHRQLFTIIGDQLK